MKLPKFEERDKYTNTRKSIYSQVKQILKTYTEIDTLLTAKNKENLESKKRKTTHHIKELPSKTISGFLGRNPEIHKAVVFLLVR